MCLLLKGAYYTKACCTVQSLATVHGDPGCISIGIIICIKCGVKQAKMWCFLAQIFMQCHVESGAVLVIGDACAELCSALLRLDSMAESSVLLA